jgi:hypothetical protein
MKQSNDRAIVTLAIGDSYVANFMRHTRPTWERYCRKHGYDLILLTEPIDPKRDATRKSIHWQKLLIGTIPQLREYAGLAWLDGDILINDRLAPCLFSQVRGGGIGVVDGSDWFYRADDVFNIHSRYLLLNYFMKRKRGGTLPRGVDKVTITDGDLAEYYRFLGFPGRAERMINTGLFVFSPAAHSDFLVEVYRKYDRDFMDFENTPLSYELQAGGRAEYIDKRFNVVWSAVAAEHYPFLFNEDLVADHAALLRLCANAAFRNAYFLHFAAGANNPIVKGAFDLIDHEADNVVALTFPDLWARRDEHLELCALKDIDATGRGIVF